MSAEVIQFIPRPRRDREQTDFPMIAFRLMLPDSEAEHVDTAPREYLPSDWQEK